MLDLDALDALAKEVAAFKESVRSITEELNAEKERAVGADSALAEWEDKVRACKETTAVVTAERGREGELETLKCKFFNISGDESLIVQLRAFFCSGASPPRAAIGRRGQTDSGPRRDPREHRLEEGRHGREGRRAQGVAQPQRLLDGDAEDAATGTLFCVVVKFTLMVFSFALLFGLRFEVGNLTTPLTNDP